MRQILVLAAALAFTVAQPLAAAEPAPLSPGKPAGIKPAQASNMPAIYGGVIAFGALLAITIGVSGSSISSAQAQTAVTTQMRLDIQIESFLARGIYWIGLLVGLGIAGGWIWVIAHNGYARDDIMHAPAAVAIALVVYFLAWAWRWLWTGRTDHLLAPPRHMPPGRVDEMRKNVTSLLALR